MPIRFLRPAVAVVMGGFLSVALAWGFAARADVPGSAPRLVAVPGAAAGGHAETERLQSRIEQLERRIGTLERQMAAIAEARKILPLDAEFARPEPAAPRILPHPPTEPRPSRIPSHLPRGSQRGEINGMPFYVIPLHGRSGQGPRPDSPSGVLKSERDETAKHSGNR